MRPAKQKSGQGDWNSVSFEIHSGILQGYAFFHNLCNRNSGQAVSGVQIGTNVYVPNFANVNGIMLLSKNYREMQNLLDVVNQQAALACASKTKAISALTLGSMFVSNGQDTAKNQQSD